MSDPMPWPCIRDGDGIGDGDGDGDEDEDEDGDGDEDGADGIPMSMEFEGRAFRSPARAASRGMPFASMISAVRPVNGVIYVNTGNDGLT